MRKTIIAMSWFMFITKLGLAAIAFGTGKTNLTHGWLGTASYAGLVLYYLHRTR